MTVDGQFVTFREEVRKLGKDQNLQTILSFVLINRRGFAQFLPLSIAVHQGEHVKLASGHGRPQAERTTRL